MAWDEHQRGFNVDVADHGLAEVKRHFTQTHIVYAGAHTGCSCVFFWDEGGVLVEMREFDEEDKVCTKDLLRYLAEALKANKVVEAYGCWEGDWALAHQGEQTVSVAEAMKQEKFMLPERVRVRFVE